MKLKALNLLFLSALFLSWSTAIAAPKSKKPRTKSFDSKMSQEAIPADLGDSRFHRFKLNTLLGMNIVQGSGFVSGMQFGYAPWTSTPLYVGPEFNFSLFSPGSLFSLLFGGWYGWKLQGAPKLTVSLGGVVGPGFNTYLPSLPGTALVGFLDLAIAQEVDDLVAVRAQFRPGYIGNYFAFMMNFNVSFRFP